jgi:hypothetical protein
MQHLMKFLIDYTYLYNYRLIVDSNTVKDILWAHMYFINLFNTFPICSTYITNKYHLSLFEFVDITSTKMLNYIFLYDVQKGRQHYLGFIEVL